MAIRLKRPAKILLGLIILVISGTILYKYAPGILLRESTTVDAISVDGTTVDNKITTEMAPLASKKESSKAAKKPLVSIAAYAWNAQSGIIGANGGPRTTTGSFMEKNGVNLFFQRRDAWGKLQAEHMKFTSEFAKGVAFPKNGVFGVIIMGDGAPMYISEMNKALAENFGAGRFSMEVAGAVGISNGEDKLIGPPIWKNNPQEMRGSLIATVVGDGDWVTVVNYAAANGIPVNPNIGTYDAQAINFFDSEDGDYINSAKELIKSQLNGWEVPLKVIDSSGKLTGETINKKVDGCATWTPGDAMVFNAFEKTDLTFVDIVSTREFNNQMPTTLIVLRQWAQKNKSVVSNILKSAYQSANQMKQYDQWARRNAEAVATTYQEKTADYWYEMFKGKTGEKGGLTYSMGGSRVFNLADAKEYYGITGYLNRYEAVYNQVSKYLMDLSPMDFVESVGEVTPYAEAVNLEYINDIKGIEEGSSFTSQIDYDKEATELLSSREWQITFKTGSAYISAESRPLLREAYNLMVQAERTRMNLEGHTDDVGNDEINFKLSSNRAAAVKNYLIKLGIPANRFQSVEGFGETKPKTTNATEAGRAQNRRVVITMLQ